MLGGIGIQEIAIILIVGILVFGAARLPKIAKSLGQGIKEFKKTVKDLDEDEDENKIKYVDQGPQYAQPQPGQYNGGMQYQQPLQGQPPQGYAQQPQPQASQPVTPGETGGGDQGAKPEQGGKTS
jgi:sec-independent protein translocase protein TatA